MSVAVQPVWTIQAAACEAPSTIRVKNLQSSIRGPNDAWGRAGREQPMLVSAEVGLRQPFGSSSSGDTVATDTVHYGLLSKALMKCISRLNAAGGEKAQQGRQEEEGSRQLEDVVDDLWAELTGGQLRRKGEGEAKKGFLDVSQVLSLSVTVHLPKATLLGAGASYTQAALCGPASAPSSVQKCGMRFGLHDVKVPTLIGVNDNERLAKQVVVANLEVDKAVELGHRHHELEALVVDVMSSSAYETLEALAADLSHRVAKHLHQKHGSSLDVVGGSGWELKLTLEKPVAVPFAEAACVELRSRTEDMIEQLQTHTSG